MITTITAIISLLVGALLQHILGTRAESRKQHALLRAAAYADFLRGVSMLASIDRTLSSSEKVSEALALVGDARARVAIYGSEMTVKTMAAVSLYPQLTTRKACETFVRACRQMRMDTHAEGALTDDELSLVLFGQSLKELPER